MPSPPARGSANLAVALGLASAGLAAVARGRALDDALDAATAGAPPAERAAARDIAYRACRRLNLLDALCRTLLAKPNPALDALLRAALSELIDHPERAHRVVDQAVDAAADRHGGAFKPVVNAVLRRFGREREALLAGAQVDEAVRLQYPHWWIERVRTAWPEDWQAVLDAGNRHPPLILRANRRRITAADLATRLTDDGIATRTLPGDALLVEEARPAASLPGFEAGLFSIQDLGAQLAAPLLDVRDGMRVLDACAAPGGKTAHLLEIADCAVVALDRDAGRLRAVDANLARLGLAARSQAADAAATATWWNGQPFERILLDAPCTASGVIRRHPDGKWLKRAGDADALGGEQSRLLAALWQVLGPGGKLLYATCSVFPTENQHRIASFLNTHPDASRLPLDIAVAHRDGQLLPSGLHDGFYYALLQKAG